jgi:endonuclease/exonuclease/phosphatase family metal-dependent hydrolase
MRLLSYNLRNAGIREETLSNSWDCRREGVVDLIKNEDPDLLALQEDSNEQLKYIQNALNRSHDVFLEPAFYEADKSYNAILVRNTLKVGDTGAFWICGNGRTQSKVNGSICFRHATFVRLQQPTSLLVVNVHLDHTDDPVVKRDEMRVFIRLLSAIAGHPPARTVVMGDFNDVPTMEPHSLLGEFGMADTAELNSNNEGTFSCWTREPPTTRIDYIWLSNDLKSSVNSYRVSRGAFRRQDGSAGYASDHAAVLAQFDI